MPAADGQLQDYIHLCTAPDKVPALRLATLEAEFEHMARYGDGTELFVLEAAGMRRADVCIAVTGDDEDNIIIGQVAREHFEVDNIVARVNDPRNQIYFDLLGITRTDRKSVV